MSIYKPCDIRGRAETELSADLYARWGAALGGMVPAGGRFVAGGDGRRSTPGYLDALASGLASAGVELECIGQAPTPLIYFAARHLRAAGCAIVTASHNRAEINGLKWTIEGVPPTEAEVAALRDAAEAIASPPPVRPRYNQSLHAIEKAYRAMLADAAGPEARAAERTVVVDCLLGVWAGRAGEWLRSLFPRCRFVAIHDRCDPEFGGRSPDCARVENLADLAAAVVEERADLGIAFDGDGDRVAWIDNEGVPHSPEQAAWMLLECLGPQLAGRPFVYDLKFSRRVPEAAAARGADPIAERSGHAFIRRRMQASGAALGAEISGHYFFAELDGGDDGLYAACRVLGWLGRTGRRLSEIRRACPSVFLAPDLRVNVAAERRGDVLRQVAEAWREYPQTALDGVRVELPGGWILVRNSVTESAMTFRFEAAGADELRALVREFARRLPGLGDEVRRRFEGGCEGEHG